MKQNKWAFLLILSLFVTSCGFYRRVYYDIDNVSSSAKVNKSDFSSDYGDFVIEYEAHSSNVCIRNNSNETLFIDLGESYFVVNGNATRLYENSVSATTSSSSITINNPRSILNGISVGEATTNYVMSERYISIPPRSYCVVNGKPFPMPVSSIKKPGKYPLDWRKDSFEYVFSYTYDFSSNKYRIARDRFSPSSLIVYRNLPKNERGAHGADAQEEWVPEPWKSFICTSPLLLAIPLALILGGA